LYGGFKKPVFGLYLETMFFTSLSKHFPLISCVLADQGEDLDLKKMLLKNHTLEAVFSMPNELFYNSNVINSTKIFNFCKTIISP
jgi:hypothetical protein